MTGEVERRQRGEGLPFDQPVPACPADRQCVPGVPAGFLRLPQIDRGAREADVGAGVVPTVDAIRRQRYRLSVMGRGRERVAETVPRGAERPEGGALVADVAPSRASVSASAAVATVRS